MTSGQLDYVEEIRASQIATKGLDEADENLSNLSLRLSDTEKSTPSKSPAAKKAKRRDSPCLSHALLDMPDETAELMTPASVAG